MRKARNTFRMFVGKPLGQQPLGKMTGMWQNNIK
jgi:hypothetical protein